MFVCDNTKPRENIILVWLCKMSKLFNNDSGTSCWWLVWTQHCTLLCTVLWSALERKESLSLLISRVLMCFTTLDSLFDEVCLMMFKVKNNLVPWYMQTFTPVSVVHDHNTRSAARGDCYVSRANLKYYTRGFQYEGTRLWNNISGSIQQSASIPVSRYMKNYFTQ